MKKNLKKMVALVMAVAMTVSLAACGSKEEKKSENKDQREIVLASSKIVKNFDLKNLASASDNIAFEQVYDTLVHKEKGEFVGYLAKEWEISEDGLTYTFHLRDGVKWSDGEPFTAEDVAFTIDYIKNECSQWAYMYDCVDNVEVVDDLTVIYHLSSAKAQLLSMMNVANYGTILPKHAYEKWGDEYGTSVDKIVGTGPYTVTAWEPDVSVSFEAKEDYYMGAPQIKKTKYVAVADLNAATVALQTGECDLYMNPVTGVALDTLRNADGIAITEYLSCRNESVYMNCQSGIFTDVRMRQAVAYALNKEEALEVCASGQGQVVNYPCDIGDLVVANPDFTPSTTYPYDVEKAKALVKECGNEGAEVVIKSYNTEPYATLCVWLQGALSAIGLDAKVEPMEPSAFLDELKKGTVDICPFSWNDISYDFGAGFGVYMGSGNVGYSGNYGNYINDEADELLRLGTSAGDVEQRKVHYRDLVELYMKDVPSVALYANKIALAHTDDIEPVEPTAYRMFMYHWVEE